MTGTMRWRHTLAGLILASVACLSQAADTAGSKTADNTSEFTLSNGLRLIVREDHRAPTVAHVVWYRAGSLDEFNGTTGVAHVLEHMMFKGTKAVGPGQFSRQVAALGGRENAFTSKDYTGYFEQTEKSRLPEMMRLEADRMANLTLSGDEFAKEIQVVMEERRLRTDDQPRALLYEQLMASALVANPYRRPIVGWMDDLQHMTVQDARDWYARWYAPNNAVVVVSGDVDPAQVKQLAETYYGSLKPHALPDRRPQNEPAQLGVRRVFVKAPAENPHVMLAWRAPRLTDVEKDDDVYALQVLAAVLDGYGNARLTSRLVREQRIANDVGANYDGVGRGPQFFLLDGTPAKDKTPEQLEKALRAQVADIAAHGVTAAELGRVKAQVVASQIYKRDSVFGQAMEIGLNEMSGISWRQIDRMLDKVKAVTPAQVQAVAGKYFGDASLTVATLVPQPIDEATRKRRAQGAEDLKNMR
ncbi:pitrilysin family protein [Pandoraea sp. XJJ-1]|uniref:M16 family metallopeptidase n=1 Tax=unclassified Pandoraea TaxID=2624094 RepID=UPI00037ED553|nr:MULTISPECIES: pitrilysin family protein [unclassified Pandoraea]OJY21519.1 MAG: peptidase M16 [Pandoraea sp. 64-18]WAL83369.1 pitrilysin family protein [Pandoraea sp. XJJ-1]BDD91424.1 zinc protease [Pandoraea sp. NE5]